MNKTLLEKHIQSFLEKLNNEPEKLKTHRSERKERINYYQGLDKNKILDMTEDDLLEYLSKLWAMLIWGNKAYVVNKLVNDNGFSELKNELAELIYGDDSIESRWDRAMKNIKGMGPAMYSEILCYVHPNKYMIWNRRAFVGLNYLGVKDLPKYNYQLNGKKYVELCNIAKSISKYMKSLGEDDTSLLAVDYFIWEELQFAENLSKIYLDDPKSEIPKEEFKFIHNEVRDAIRDIGIWLGFNSEIEKRVADGSKVDAVWESSIGNMGRVMYVFEVQTKGSIDSLIVNLLKAKNNPAVQGVVAVSDEEQLIKIKKHAAEVQGLGSFLRTWNYKEVWKVHESLEFVNSSINKLKLVPDTF